MVSFIKNMWELRKLIPTCVNLMNQHVECNNNASIAFPFIIPEPWKHFSNWEKNKHQTIIKAVDISFVRGIKVGHRANSRCADIPG